MKYKLYSSSINHESHKSAFKSFKYEVYFDRLILTMFSIYAFLWIYITIRSFIADIPEAMGSGIYVQYSFGLRGAFWLIVAIVWGLETRNKPIPEHPDQLDLWIRDNNLSSIVCLIGTVVIVAIFFLDATHYDATGESVKWFDMSLSIIWAILLPLGFYEYKKQNQQNV